MIDKEVIQNYINNFKTQISRALKYDIEISSVVYPCKEDGAIIEFKFGKGIKSVDEYKKPFNRIADALAIIEQRAFAGELASFNFLGTNYIMEFLRLILIKDNSPSEWTMKQAHKDARKFIIS